MTGPRSLSFAALAVTALCGLGALAAALWSADRSFDFTDEALYIYLLANPGEDFFFADYRIWSLLGAPFGHSIVFYRLLPAFLSLIAAAGLAWAVCVCLKRKGLALTRMDEAVITVLTVTGGLLFFSLLRPTMNYAVTAFVAANGMAILLLIDYARSPARSRAWVLCLLGLSITAMGLGRFSAAMLALVMLLAYVWMLRPGGGPWERIRASALLLAAAGLAMAGAQAWIVDYPTMLALMGVAASGTHTLSAILVYDAKLLAATLAITAVLLGGYAGAQAVIAGMGGAGPRQRALLLSTGLALAVAGLTALWAWLYGRPPPASADPFQQNDIGMGYGAHGRFISAFTFAFMALAAWITWRQRGSRPQPGAWTVPLMVTLILLGAAYTPFAGTNTGIIRRSVLNGAPFFAVIGVMMVYLSRHLKAFDPARLTLAAVPLGVFVLVTVVSATLIHPVRSNGSAFAQTVSLENAGPLTGLRVSPAVARLHETTRSALRDRRFDPLRDKLVAGPNQPGLLVLAGGTALGSSWYMHPDHNPLHDTYNCAFVKTASADGLARVIGLNTDGHSPVFRGCLAEMGLGVDAAPRAPVSPHLTLETFPVGQTTDTTGSR